MDKELITSTINKISVVIPLYKCDLFIHELTQRLVESLMKITNDFEIIYVNDNSPTNDWQLVLEEIKIDNRVKGINFSKNFGQHYAITAGLDYASGEWVVVMDGDLQDQPEEIEKLYHKAQEGFDIVMARRTIRNDSLYKKFSSAAFFFVLNYLTGEKYNPEIANFSIANKNAKNAIISFRESYRTYPYLLKSVGFNQTDISVQHASRPEGNSSYTFKKLIDLAFNSIISQTNKPLKLFIKFGLLMAFLAFLFGVYIIVKKIFVSVPIEGWTSLIVSLYFIGGLLLANLGVLGLYLGKVFDETKQKPLYIIKDKKGFD